MLKRVCFVVFVVSVAALLAGCGSSSKTSSSSTNASAATTTTGATTTGATGTATTGAKAAKGPTKRAFTKFATCMRANGVNFPLPNTSGKGPIFSAKGVDVRSTKFRVAEVKCRGDLLGAFAHRRDAGKTLRIVGSHGSAGQTKTSPAPKLKVKVPPKVAHALEHFTACMREHGITNFPEPEGASFNMSHTHVDTHSAQYKAAEKACNPILNAVM
jgi:hypothetical protein